MFILISVLILLIDMAEIIRELRLEKPAKYSYIFLANILFRIMLFNKTAKAAKRNIPLNKINKSEIKESIEHK